MSNNSEITVDACSVKVMRSFDYCHFEVCLTATRVFDTMPPAAIDELRKTAARLADKAVEQYKVAKANAELAVNDSRKLERLQDDAREIEAKPEKERTPGEQARLKAIQDLRFARHRYDYEDDFEEEEEWRPEIPEADDAIF